MKLWVQDWTSVLHSILRLTVSQRGYQSSIQMAPDEALYGRRPSCWTKLGGQRVLGPELVSPWKKVLIFGRKGKLSPRFIGPYHILKHVGPVAYQLELHPKLDRIHDVFHVSMLRRYRSDPTILFRLKRSRLGQI
ncbi:reverse transcriptase [Gossypium australe]|uniref:Reverse transcriptase n=1 Tax=Gossypium australe TaxID=47621 RepID=A0A5B6VYW4_9ROSI|nr:reverse transcriptase [Gossypium australe]